MILGAIASFFKRVLTLFIRATAWLVVALSLWIPLLYSIAFLIICAAASKNPAQLSTIFWSGFAASFVLAFIISGTAYDRKRNGAKRPRQLSESAQKLSPKSEDVRLKKRAQAQQAQQEPLDVENAKSAQPPAQTAQSAMDISQVPQNQQNQQTQSQLGSAKPQFSPNVQNQSQQSASFQGTQGHYQQQSRFGVDNDLTGGYRQPIEGEFMSRRDSFGANAYEKPEFRQEPRIFATRKDPTIFVYEYFDRIEFHKRTRGGMVLMETRYKNP